MLFFSLISETFFWFLMQSPFNIKFRPASNKFSHQLFSGMLSITAPEINKISNTGILKFK